MKKSYAYNNLKLYFRALKHHELRIILNRHYLDRIFQGKSNHKRQHKEVIYPRNYKRLKGKEFGHYACLNKPLTIK